MTIIDASTLAKFILKEEGWEQVAEHLRAGTQSIDHIVKRSQTPSGRGIDKAKHPAKNQRSCSAH